MSLRVCGEPNCPVLIPAGTRDGRCADHRRVLEQQRGTRAQRGYDAAFDRAKKDPEYVTATHCWTCGEEFTPDNPKTAGHRVAIRRGGRGSPIFPECRRCNYGWKRSGS